MNILVSYNWLKEYLKTGLSPEEFASRVSLSGPSVERINYQEGADLDKIVVGKILNITKHPNADKLRLVEVDLGKKKVTVVCGGSNLQGGMKVAVALSGAKVKWHGEGELVELKPTEIRGVKSEGMICAAEEIGLGEQFPKKDEKEILDLSDLGAKPGALLAEALNLKDAIFDIEVTSNRPDMMSVVGIAREAGTILKSSFTMPKIAPLKGKDNGISLKIKNDEPELCLRYQAVVIEGVKVAPSPWWLKQKLASAGTRSINNIVDITNLVLWEMGQPLHAFDYEKLAGGSERSRREVSIVVRRAKKGEKIKALDGVEYKLAENYLLIADGKKPVAIAGVMGGELSGVTNGTKTIVLEAASFEPVSVRRTSRALNLRSESSNLFEKGLSTEATTAALARAAELVAQLAGGKIASKIFDLRSKEYKPRTVALSAEKANKIMGVELETEEMADILSRLGFSVSVKGGEIKAKAPYWREGDIAIEEDLIEEIARVYGYHRLPSVLPSGYPPFGKGREGFFSGKNQPSSWLLLRATMKFCRIQ
ncbi:MAG: phenylalanine--tRNA ligase subunit beta [bacterium]